MMGKADDCGGRSLWKTVPAQIEIYRTRGNRLIVRVVTDDGTADGWKEKIIRTDNEDIMIDWEICLGTDLRNKEE